MSNFCKTYSAALWNTICGCFFAEKRCIACHAPFVPVEQNYLCSHCTPHINKKQDPVCTLCGHKLYTNTNICIECTQKPPPWDALSFYGQYDKLIKAIILKYKFSANFSMLPLLSHYLFEACKNLPACDLVVPMPRHEKRLVAEGFNHTLELCRPLAKQLKIPLQHKALIRTRYTPPQSSLPAAKRKNNPQKSFEASQVAGKNVLLVDDIITTGSTLKHACMALRAAGAKRIYIALIARVEK